MALPHIAPYALPTELPESVAHWSLEPHRAALLVHDMQNYFLDAYPAHTEPITSVIANIRHLVEAFDSLQAPVFYSAQPPAQTPEWRGLLTDLWGAGIPDTHGAQIIPQLQPQPHHQRITKSRYSAFHSTPLHDILTTTHRDQLVIVGVYGHIGCQITAADAFMRNIQPFLLADAIADFTPDDHTAALAWVARRAGIVTDTRSALHQLRQPSAHNTPHT